MRCELKDDGFLHVTAETGLEGYALSCWADIDLETGKRSIIINYHPKETKEEQ